MTGFPVEQVEALAAPQAAAAADRALEAGEALDAAAADLLAALRGLGRDARRARKLVERRRPVAGLDAPTLAGAVARYNQAIAEHDRLRAGADSLFEADLSAARGRLRSLAADERFQHVLLLSSPGLAAVPAAAGSGDTRGERRREQTWAAYLQRLTTKNETISFFGPSVWGRVDPESPVLVDIELRPGDVDARTVYVERWLCDALAARMSEDADVQPLLPWHLAAHLWIDPDGRARTVAGEVLDLSAEEADIVARCGRRGGVLAAAEPVAPGLIERGLLSRSLSLPICRDPFEELRRVVREWPAGAARARWEPVLSAISAHRDDFARDASLAARREVLSALAELLAPLGVGVHRRSQALYAARLPLNEDCRRAAERVVVGRPLVELVTSDLAPWYDLWRDLAGLFASRVLRAAAQVHEALGGEPVSLPVFLSACAKIGMPLGKAGGKGLFPELTAEVQAAWSEQIGARAADREVHLTALDLAFLRDRFELRRMRAFDAPAPDVQVIASDARAAREGRARLLLAEIHPDWSLWQQGFLSFCPAPDRLIAEYEHEGHPPAVVFDAGAGQEPVHVMNCAPLATPGWTFVGPPGGSAGASIRAADTLVEVTGDDVLLRARDGRPLGSLVHTWHVALNTHQLDLTGTGPHSPRLCVGRVIVQRESWVVTAEDALGGAEARGPTAFRALRALRRRLSLPERVFARPILPIRLSLHKDGKPVFVDFRSPHMVDALAQMLIEYGSARLTEMLPDVGDFWLADGRGHYSCELRFATIPGPP